MNGLNDLASLVAAEVTMFHGTVLSLLPEQYKAQYTENMKAVIEEIGAILDSDSYIEDVVKEAIAKSHVTSMAFVANNNVRTANDLTSLLYSVLLLQSESFANVSPIDDLERLAGPETATKIYNWFSSYGKDLSTLVRPKGTTLN